MNIVLKHAIKDWIPPALLRWLTGARAAGEDWGRPSLGLDGIRLPGGNRFHLRPTVADQNVFRQVFLDREYTFREMARAGELYAAYGDSEAPLIIDAGANIGAASVWFALTFPKATIIAIEPDRGNYGLLQQNTERFANIIPVNAAIASTSGSLYLCDPGQGAWGYRTAAEPTAHSYSVPSMTVEEIMDKAPGRLPFILKIDIEGAESDLFQRPCARIDSFPLVTIELHDWMLPGQSNSRNFLRWHVEKNRDLVFRGENAFSIANTPLAA